MPREPKKVNRTTWVKAKLRSASLYWPPRSEAMRLARVERGKYRCSLCLDLFRSNQVQLDHIEPVVDVRVGFVDFNTFIERLFCDVENFSVVCKACHESKTAIEDSMRQFHKKRKK